MMEIAVGLAVLAVLLLLFVRLVRPAVRGPAQPDGQSDFDRLVGKPAGPPPPKAAAQPCRWVRDHFRNDAKEARWVCDDCGAEAFQQGTRKPDTCRRADARLAMKTGW